MRRTRGPNKAERARRHRLYIAVKADQAEFAAHEIGVPEGYRRGVHAGRVFPKDCWRKACRYAVDHHEDGAMLVHGTIEALPGCPIDHAWVELPGSVVFDGILQRFYHKAAYYAAQGARCRLRVGGLTAARIIARGLAEYGPWTAGLVAAVRTI